MIQHLALFELAPQTTEASLEELQRSTRSQLLKIPGILAVRAGRNLDTHSNWGFFFALEVESREKLRICREDPIFVKFEQAMIKPLTINRLEQSFEMDPAKPLKYS
jgi:hypothetical protein